MWCAFLKCARSILEIYLKPQRWARLRIYIPLICACKSLQKKRVIQYIHTFCFPHNPSLHRLKIVKIFCQKKIILKIYTFPWYWHKFPLPSEIINLCWEIYGHISWIISLQTNFFNFTFKRTKTLTIWQIYCW
jgi:hypothetical protein